MKKYFIVLITLILLLLFNFSAFSQELEVEEEEFSEYVEEEVEEIEEFELGFEEEEEEENLVEEKMLLSAQPPPEYNYSISLSNISNYSIVALNDAFIDMHIRGSIWVGGTLTSNSWCGTDDGSINHVPSGTESYIYNNASEMYFQGRTENQSKEAYKLLSYDAVESTRHYWQSFAFPNDETQWIYVKPDENGYVNLCKWDYQAQGSDETKQTIEKVYWTDASKVDMGGLAGHLFAPFAEVNVTWCNHGGSIVGWNITTHGEAHINYWKPDFPSETPTPTPSETPTPTPTPTITPSPTPTSSEETTIEPTITPELTATPTISPSPTPTPVPTNTPTPIPTNTPTVEPTNEVIIEPTPTETPVITLQPSDTPSPKPTATLTSASATIAPTKTPAPEITPEPTVKEAPEVEITAEPTPSPSPTPLPTMKPEQREAIIRYAKEYKGIKKTSHFANMTEEELEELIDIMDYEVPLYGDLLATGDEVPIWVFISIIISVICISIYFILKNSGLR